MLLGELLTLVQGIAGEDHRVQQFVAELRRTPEMKADGLVSFGTDLENPNFAAVAEIRRYSLGWSVRNRRTCHGRHKSLARTTVRRCSM